MADRLFHKTGLIYFWFLNDSCEDELVDRYVDAFAAAGVAAVVLHPRAGMLLPYGGDDWFDFIRRTSSLCARKGVPVWLYDEDPYPSGACGGMLTAEHPEFEARAVERFVPDTTSGKGNLFCFPMGNLLWCGAVRESDGAVMDFTGRVGVVRRDWKLLDPWDSRWYYPNTPLYSCRRSDTYTPEYALRIPELPNGYRLQAFVARPSGGQSLWGQLPDTLNPVVTREFIRRTYERYRQSVGDMFGKEIAAMFTDEPKYFGHRPWTPGLFEHFEKQFGYDLRPGLWRLFSDTTDERSMITRLDYRQWCGDRFRNAWLEPVSDWCRRNKLALVGHISPEDDPVEQVGCVSNLFPCFNFFTLPGIDLIIPAVGDSLHPLINIGVISAVSAAQQHDKPGVMSESLGCSGPDATVEMAGRILRWQMMMGVTTHVIHGAFNSVEGQRANDAPPDWGPASPHWTGMTALGRELALIQPVVRDASQIAPVAILWPIRSFNANPFAGYSNDTPMRDDLEELVRLCLDRQVGIHLLDEADLLRAGVSGDRLVLGRARYSHVVIPSCTVLHEKTEDALRAASAARVQVLCAGQGPQWIQGQHGLRPANLDFARVMKPADAAASLPRLIEIGPDATDIRCTVWEKEGRQKRLVMNLAAQDREIKVAGRSMRFSGGRIHMIE